MNTAVLVSSPRVAARKLIMVAMLLATIALGLGIAFPGYALDLVAFTGITGPLTSALTQIAALGPGIKALVGFVGFVTKEQDRRLTLRLLLPKHKVETN